MAGEKKEIGVQKDLKLTDAQREALAEAFGEEIARKIEAIRLVGIGDSVQSVVVIN